jgi:hypothetical protein
MTINGGGMSLLLPSVTPNAVRVSSVKWGKFEGGLLTFSIE